MQTLTLPTIADIDNPQLLTEVQGLLDNKTKLVGALGRLESSAMQIGLIQGSTTPKVENPNI